MQILIFLTYKNFSIKTYLFYIHCLTLFNFRFFDQSCCYTIADAFTAKS